MHNYTQSNFLAQEIMGVCPRALGAKQSSAPGTPSCCACSAVWLNYWKTGYIFLGLNNETEHLHILCRELTQNVRVPKSRR